MITNEGDGPAFGLRIAVPAPIGCVAVSDDDAARDVERLDPGERAELALEARIVEPVREVLADDGEVRCANGVHVTLPARDGVVLRPVLAAPRAEARVGRRRVDLAVDLVNDGWVDARDVCLRIVMPRELRGLECSVVVDGVPVTGRGGRIARPRASKPARRPGCGPETRAVGSVERDGDAHVVLVAMVPARGSTQVAFAAAFPADYAGGTITVAAGEHIVEIPFAVEPVRDVRVRVVEVPRAASPAECVRVGFRVVNAGDVAERLSFELSGPLRFADDVRPRTLPAGTWAVVDAPVRVPDEAVHDDIVCAAFAVSDASGERGRDEFRLRIRDRARLFAEADPSGTAESVGIAEPMGESVSAAVHAPERVLDGAPFSVRLDIDVQAGVETLRIRVPASPSCSYIAGSASLDGRSLLDGPGDGPERSPFGGDGVVLRSVPAATRIALGWRMVADARAHDVPLMVTADVDADGDVRRIESDSVTVGARDSFSVRPQGLPYHIESCAIDPNAEPACAIDPNAERALLTPTATVPVLMDVATAGLGAFMPVEFELRPDDDRRIEPTSRPEYEGSYAQDNRFDDDAPIDDPTQTVPTNVADAFSLRLDRGRLDELARLIDVTPREGLVTHLFALRFFFPDSVPGPDDVLERALGAVRAALYDTFDRLYVKLRIPGFDLTSDDLDDAPLRRALIALFERLAERVSEAPPYESACAVLTQRRIEELRAPLPEASYGAPSVLRALIALLPSRCADDAAFADALRRCARALDDALSCYDGLPLEIFDDALAHRTDPALERARDEVLGALRPHLRRPVVA
ncbi:MAG TPA: hypothetical protein VGD01_17575 [Candidatus Elarobacter sp.]